MNRTLVLLIGLIANSTVCAAALEAQAPRGLAPEPPSAGILRADQLHGRLQPEAALDSLDSLLQRQPENYHALWRAAREAVSLGMLDLDPTDAKIYYDRAEAYARRAIDVNPGGVDGQHYLAVAMGRQALSEGIRARVQMAEGVRAQAELVLSMDSLYASAHHVLGMWHAEVKRLDRLSRFVARRILGGDGFGDASWEDAEAFMRRAVELEPEVIMHHLELARILLDRDREDEAREELRIVLDLTINEPIDPLHQQRAQELLRDLAGA